jgi:hypothetical protein
MALYVAQGQCYFEGDATDLARAQWLEAAAKSLAQQTANPGTGTAAERQSYFGVWQVNANGTTTLVQAWHVDGDGIVRSGVPVADQGPGTPATAPAWVQPTGAHDAYPIGARVTYAGQTWESKINANTTVPNGDVPFNRYWMPV